MTLRELIQSELIDVIEWLEESPDAIVWRFSRNQSAIKNGAQLIVRPGQVAVFVDQGRVADVFMPGRHQLATQNLPVLSTLRGWKYGFESPFKADVIFVSTRQLPSHKWGTKTPVMLTDRELGPIRLRAYGTYLARVQDAPTLVRELVGTNAMFAIDDIADQLRDLIVARFSEVLGDASVSILQLASQYSELATRTVAAVQPDLAKLGLELSRLVVESIALPDEVAATLDQRTRIGLIGDVSAYAALQAADAVRDSARNPGMGGVGAALGAGIAIASQMSGTIGDALRTAHASTGAAVVPPPIPSPTAFYVAEQQQPLGPLDRGALRALAQEGRLTRDTLVWSASLAGWTSAGDVPDVASLLTTPGMP